MGSVNSIVEQFLIAYTQNKLNTIRNLFDSDITIHYSTVGNCQGVDNVISKLSFCNTYDINTVTTTNEMSYNEGDIKTVFLIAHHLIANEFRNELYPLCFGGKYVFKINSKNNTILAIYYAQEYQVENTLYIKDWHLASRKSDLSVIYPAINEEKLISEMMQKEDLKQKLSFAVKLLCYALDAGRIELLNTLTCENVVFIRPKTMSYGKIMTNHQSEISKFIREVKDYYSMDQYSIRVNSLVETNHSIEVHVSHLVPHRTGTKKLNSNTKYHSFFDEDITITFNKINDTYLVQSFICKKMADVHYNGFEILRFD